MFASLSAPAASSSRDAGQGARALILAPSRELAHQIHNECLKLAQGRKWRIVLFSKATANTLADKNVRDKVGKGLEANFRNDVDVLISDRYHNQYTITDGVRTTGGQSGA